MQKSDYTISQTFLEDALDYNLIDKGIMFKEAYETVPLAIWKM